jgi:Zn-dependent peptidase ImmA (M78 family)
MAPRWEFARRMARKYLRKHRVDAPPVPVEYLLFLENVRVEVLDYPDATAGESWWDAETPCIAVSRSLARTRLRFTLAHEWGHLALGHHRHAELARSAVGRRLHDVSTDLWEAPDPVEIEASVFAGELLMPESFFRPDWTRAPDPRRLALRYEVSETAVRWRVRSLLGRGL